ncbi:Ankyrin [Mycena sanguinolenta]|uniref:Ankyrin n=1 Tax=Mycena sanguinolenta TaxID=230812 RepID=A0A8H6XL22_9AGAR|nr:Ankyrin [Mycena sanguinolenta]
MAELVGLVASVLQLVDTIKRTRDCIHGLRNAPKQQKLLLMEIQSLEPLLKELDARTTRSSGLQKFEEPLIQLRVVITRLAKKLNADHTGRKSNCLTWTLWDREDIQEGLDTVERFKGLLSVWFELDIWDFAQGIIDILATIKDASEDHDLGFKAMAELQEQHYSDIFKSVSDIAQHQDQYHTAAQRDSIIEWYSPLNFFLHQADIFRIHQPGTGRWFLETNSFKDWKSGIRRVLCCRGMPGAGKTVLVSIAVDYLQAEQEHCDDIGVAVIYLNHKETDRHAPSTLVASLWRQLVVGKSITSVDKLYGRHRERCTKPSLDDSLDILMSTISQYIKVFILVDALDEYPEHERGILMLELSRLGSNVNLLFTSRPHISLDNIFPQMEVVNIEATEEDIRRHIDAQISRSPRLSKHIQNCPDLRKEIEEKIVRRSDGMLVLCLTFITVQLTCILRFLLAKLQIDSLTGKHTVKAVQAALTNLPNDLEGTYDEVMERINQQSEDDRNLAWRTLSWIFHAKRLLQPSELRTALAVEPGTTGLDPNNLLDLETILSVCEGLVDARDNRLRLIHFTAQNYLERKEATAFPHASTQIALACIEYLSFKIFQQQMEEPLGLFHRHSFLDYAVEYCLLHARGEPELRILPAIVSFLATGEGWWDLWNWKHKYRKGQTLKSPLLIATFFGLQQVCQHILKTDGPGNALQLAAADGHVDGVLFLLRNGVDVHGKEGEFDSALHAAAAHGRGAIISLLLAHGLGVDYRGASGTALQVAAHFGRKGCVELLIASGANVNAPPGSYYGSALYAAAFRPSYEIFCALIAAGADVQVGLAWEEEKDITAWMPTNIDAAWRTALQGHNEAALRRFAECNPESDGNSAQNAILVQEPFGRANIPVSEPFAMGARRLPRTPYTAPVTLPPELEEVERQRDRTAVVHTNAPDAYKHLRTSRHFKSNVRDVAEWLVKMACAA